MTQTELPPFSEYSDELAVEFYVPAGQSDEDAVFICEGRRLPVHLEGVLAEQSSVLRAVASARQEDGRPAPLAAAANGHLLDPYTNLEVVMSDALALAREEQSLEGFTLKRVVHFLRFAYRHEEVDAIDFELPGAAKTLSAAARLAHRLDMPALLDRLDAKMEASVGAHQATLQRLMDWAAVAEECGLRRLWTKCVREVAVTLARQRQGGCTVRTVSSQDLQAKLQGVALNGMPRVPSSSALAPGADASTTAAHDVALLRAMTPKAQLAVMAALLAGLRKAGGDPALLIPAEASLGSGLPSIWKLRAAPGSPAGELV